MTAAALRRDGRRTAASRFAVWSGDGRARIDLCAVRSTTGRRRDRARFELRRGRRADVHRAVFVAGTWRRARATAFAPTAVCARARPLVRSRQAAGRSLCRRDRPALCATTGAWPRRAARAATPRRWCRRRSRRRLPSRCRSAAAVQPGGLIYEVPVRAFTMRHPDVPEQLRGTIAALAASGGHRASAEARRRRRSN